MKCGLLPPSFEDTILNICQCVSPNLLSEIPVGWLLHYCRMQANYGKPIKSSQNQKIKAGKPRFSVIVTIYDYLLTQVASYLRRRSQR